MSRLTELKKQYPELAYSIIDFFDLLDISGSRKYLPLLCKLLKEKVVLKKEYEKSVREQLVELGIDSTKIPYNKIYLSNWFVDILDYENIKTFNKFMKLMEDNLIDKKDVTSYNSFDEISFEISKAEFRTISKSLSKQVHHEYEDDNWLVIRPLTFESSKKYGASTKWCTTSERHPEHFVKYWNNGILVYFINKITGYKFAGYKELFSIVPELSFWDVRDSRIDSLQLGIEDYMFGVIKKIFSSTQSNEDLCSDEQKRQVYKIDDFNTPTQESHLIDDEDVDSIFPMRVEMGGVHSVDILDEPNESITQIDETATSTSTVATTQFKFFYH
jgi:hypothetical protein